MKNDLEPSLILRAYESIIRHGTQTERGKIYQGVEAYSDYDGYNVYLKSNGVELSVGFHNTYHFNYEQSYNKDSFISKIALLAK
ncbi:DUF3081 domain-containing protein [Vibrio renipiscarius]|uniref:DUF3081 domain-containing protein n=1 Tax=Vibrio renipiscarius TaxID=1461322 RepID=UPI003551B030